MEGVGVIPASLSRDPKVVVCRHGVAEIRNMMVQSTQGLDRFGPRVV